jgi:hypothetical protein
MMFLLFTTNAQAANAGAQAAQAKIARITCEPKEGELISAVYRCIKKKLDGMAEVMVLDVYQKLRKAVLAVLTLAIVFFAIKFVLYGTRQMQSEFIITVLKLVVVSSLIFGIGDGQGMLNLRDVILDTGEQFQNLVLVDTGVFGVEGENIFQRMDKMLFKLYGIKPNADGKYDIKMDKDMAGIGMMGGLVLAGPLGAKAFVQGGAAVAMLVGSFMVALYIAIVSLIALTFLFALSPIFIPLMLFQPTERMFQKWRGQIVSYSLQPMIMTVFISMMFLMLGNLVGTLDNFIETARKMSNDPGVATITRAASSHTAIVKRSDPNAKVNQSEQLIQGYGPSVTGVAGKGIADTQSADMLSKGIGTKAFVIPITPFSRDQLNGLGSQMVVLLIVCGAMFRFMKELPEWASDLAGGDRTVPNLATISGTRQLEREFEAKK